MNLSKITSRDSIVKTQEKNAKNRMLEAAHEMAQGLYIAHVIDATTMREFDALCSLPDDNKCENDNSLIETKEI